MGIIREISSSDDNQLEIKVKSSFEIYSGNQGKTVSLKSYKITYNLKNQISWQAQETSVLKSPHVSLWARGNKRPN